MELDYGVYFKKSEFACNCCGYSQMNQALLDSLNQVRMLADVPFIVTSGYRCTKHNKQMGGVEHSAHTKGLAVDILANEETRVKIIHSAYVVGVERVGIYEDFIHLDIDTSKKLVSWVGD